MGRSFSAVSRHPPSTRQALKKVKEASFPESKNSSGGAAPNPLLWTRRSAVEEVALPSRAEASKEGVLHLKCVERQSPESRPSSRETNGKETPFLPP